MKNFKTALALITAALMALALFAAPSSAISLAMVPPPVDNDSANLELRPPGGAYDTGQVIEVLGNFTSATAGEEVTLYKETGAGTNDYAPVEVDSAANSSGNAYFHPTIDNGTRRYFAQDETGRQTELRSATGTVPPPSSATLNNPTNGGKTWTANFTPTKSGQTTELQVQEICTYETDETNPANGVPFNKDQPQEECQGPWTTKATSTQNSSGNSTFTIANPLEVKHKYRAKTGNTVSNIVEFAAPLPTNPYGIDTGLSELHFNTYEGAGVGTRTHYFEGAFSMTGSEKAASPTGTQCGSVNTIMKSAMKGRGNYSWSFPKKSFTLKLGTATSLCGLDSSKKYALVANDYDKSLLRNSLASYVGQKFSNMGWTPKSVPVEFYMNGEYRGSYILIERIAIEGGRLDIKELNGDDPEEQVEPKISGGYVMEWDFRRGADYNVYLGSDSGYVGIKEPENDYGRTGSSTGNGNLTDEGISSAQKTYINGHLNSADNAVRRDSCQSNDWEDFIDKDSAVDYYIAMEYMKPVDGNMWASVYMYKPRGEKIHFGPMWDFDLSSGSATRSGNVASSGSFYLRNNLQVSAMQPESATKKPDTWFNCLNKRSSFRNAVAARWDAVDMNVAGFLDGQRDLISSSATANFKRWSYSSRISEYQVIKGSWSQDVSHLRSWATGRKSWLNGSTGF